MRRLCIWSCLISTISWAFIAIFIQSFTSFILKIVDFTIWLFLLSLLLVYFPCFSQFNLAFQMSYRIFFNSKCCFFGSKTDFIVIWNQQYLYFCFKNCQSWMFWGFYLRILCLFANWKKLNPFVLERICDWSFLR